MAAVAARRSTTWPGSRQLADEILSMRERLEASGSERDLKRGFGGIVDIEFLVQLFRLKYGRASPALRTTNTWEALDALRAAGLLSAEQHGTLKACYDLRQVESRLRSSTTARWTSCPNPRTTWKSWPGGWVSRQGGCHAASRLLAELERHQEDTRAPFLELVQDEGEANRNSGFISLFSNTRHDLPPSMHHPANDIRSIRRAKLVSSAFFRTSKVSCLQFSLTVARCRVVS